MALHRVHGGQGGVDDAGVNQSLEFLMNSFANERREMQKERCVLQDRFEKERRELQDRLQKERLEEGLELQDCFEKKRREQGRQLQDRLEKATTEIKDLAVTNEKLKV